MRTDEYATRRLSEMLDVAKVMLAGRLDLIEGCRRIVSLASAVGLENDPVMVPFRGFESECDRFPRADVRAGYAPSFLERLDREAAIYLEQARNEILRSCTDLLARFDT